MGLLKIIKSARSNRKKILFILSIILFVAVLGNFLCNKKDDPKNKIPKKAEAKNGGTLIVFHSQSPGLELIKTAVVGEIGDFVNIDAPARIVATTIPSVSSGNRVVLFESAELNEIYVSYVHAKNQLVRFRKTLNRNQDMFKHRVATEKDLVDAETDVSNGQAELAEFEGKLRAVGLNPDEIGRAPIKSAWVICDIPESQLQKLKKGKKVRLNFSSFPQEEFIGKAEALGDNIDPITRTVKVRIEIQNKDYKLKPGMFASVKFPEETMSGNVVLPFTSIVTVEGKNYVFVEREKGQFHRTEVITGISNKDVVTIVEGLSPQDRVVIQGSILLKGLSFGF
ncbi:MAG: efflux RND transporter periplasmic adaptor subunit [Leptospiraceae bacterium]|jgi:cobalt-zinc-cadmium efflux system membrane fusion protein|nr:efflux RND transporter periplasmic adaptor subunit [Leptospiraceae bacterium]MCZ8347123.1 efflux RND transporter periplasmic adaptor subunit [Leptospiraceae bacterium]